MSNPAQQEVIACLRTLSTFNGTPEQARALAAKAAALAMYADAVSNEHAVDAMSMRTLAKDFYNRTIGDTDITIKGKTKDKAERVTQSAELLKHGLVRSPEYLETLSVPQPGEAPKPAVSYVEQQAVGTLIKRGSRVVIGLNVEDITEGDHDLTITKGLISGFGKEPAPAQPSAGLFAGAAEALELALHGKCSVSNGSKLVQRLRAAAARNDSPAEVAPSDEEIIDLAVEPLGIDCDRMPYGVIKFARELLARYGATGVSEDAQFNFEVLDRVVTYLSQFPEFAPVEHEGIDQAVLNIIGCIERLRNGSPTPFVDAARHAGWSFMRDANGTLRMTPSISGVAQG